MSGMVNPAILLDNIGGYIGDNPFYQAVGAAYIAYPTPTDMFSLRNPVASGKRLYVRSMTLLVKTTVAAVLNFEYHKRTALNTGGTPTAITAAQFDSRDAVPVGVARVYGSAPVIVDPNSAANLVADQYGLSAVIASTPGNFMINGQGLSIVNAPLQDMCNSLILLEGEELAANFLGVALPAGFTAIPMVQWAEYDLRNRV